MIRVLRAAAACLLLALLLAGCARPPAMRVRDGAAPRFQDDDVAFRAVYYFRVFDLCKGKAGADNAVQIPTGDALYRFRMSGKSNTLTTRVHFESGTLKSWEIDPLGAGVKFEEELGRFRFQSREELDQEVQRAKDLAEIRELIALRKEIQAELAPPEAEPNTGTPDPIVTKLEDVIGKRVSALAGVQPPPDPDPDPDADTDEQQADAASQKPALCLAGDRRRGFQILGPEGWKTFDQDDRLVLAMAADAGPILKALKELAGRVLSSQAPSGEQLLPIVQERLRLREAEAELLAPRPDETPSELVTRVLEAFERGTPETEASLPGLPELPEVTELPGGGT